MRRYMRWVLVVWLAPWAGQAGCADAIDWDKWNLLARKDPPPEPQALPAAPADPILADTVGAYTLLSSAETLRLRGFGLVVGLGDRGSSDCPTSVREYLVDFLNKQIVTAEGDQPRISPGRLIDSPDTAVVELIGDIPAGAPAGTAFDVQVSALDAQTRSLEGGVLLLSELKIFQTTPGGVIAGRPLARAAGAVFTNPFAPPDDLASRRRGYVLGGGRTLTERRVRLLLEEPSYSMARRIEQRINERFGQRPPAAEAMSNGHIELSTPPEFRDDAARFMSVVTHLYLEGAPAYIERRLRELAQELEPDDEKLNHVSLIWEGCDRKALPEIQPLYDHHDPAVRYYAARAGLRLGDVNALPALAAVAGNSDDPRQILALREIGRSPAPGTTEALARLLDHRDAQIRVAAYEELSERRHPAIRSERFPSPVDATQVNFTLDLVRSDGEPLIYVRRTAEPRIAIFGPAMPISTPLFYSHPQDLVTLDTPDASGEITVLARSRLDGGFHRPFHVPARVADVIRGLAAPPVRRRGDDAVRGGLGLPYSLVVQVLDALGRERLIAANIVLEQRDLAELIGPAQRERRPEADETSMAPAPRSEAEDL